MTYFQQLIECQRKIQIEDQAWENFSGNVRDEVWFHVEDQVWSNFHVLIQDQI